MTWSWNYWKHITNIELVEFKLGVMFQMGYSFDFDTDFYTRKHAKTCSASILARCWDHKTWYYKVISSSYRQITLSKGCPDVRVTFALYTYISNFCSMSYSLFCNPYLIMWAVMERVARGLSTANIVCVWIIYIKIAARHQFVNIHVEVLL